MHYKTQVLKGDYCAIYYKQMKILSYNWKSTKGSSPSLDGLLNMTFQ